MDYEKALNLLIEAIDYSYLLSDGSYDKSLAYPVIDKIRYIKKMIGSNKD